MYTNFYPTFKKVGFQNFFANHNQIGNKRVCNNVTIYRPVTISVTSPHDPN